MPENFSDIGTLAPPVAVAEPEEDFNDLGTPQPGSFSDLGDPVIEQEAVPVQQPALAEPEQPTGFGQRILSVLRELGNNPFGPLPFAGNVITPKRVDAETMRQDDPGLQDDVVRQVRAGGLEAGARSISGVAGMLQGIGREDLPENQASLQRYIEGDAPGVLRKFASLVQDTETSMRKVLQKVEDSAEDFKEAIPDMEPVDPEFKSSFGGQVAGGVGNALISLPTYAVAPVGVMFTVGQMYDEGRSDAQQELQKRITEGEQITPEEQERIVHDAGMTNVPGAALEVLGDKLIIGRIMKPLKGKMSVGRLLAEIGAVGVAEGVTEGAQQGWLNFAAAQLSGYAPDRKIDDQVIESAILGASVGLLVGGGGSLVTNGVSQVVAPGAEAQVDAAAKGLADALDAETQQRQKKAEQVSTATDAAEDIGSLADLEEQQEALTRADPAEAVQEQIIQQGLEQAKAELGTAVEQAATPTEPSVQEQLEQAAEEDAQAAADQTVEESQQEPAQNITEVGQEVTLHSVISDTTVKGRVVGINKDKTSARVQLPDGSIEIIVLSERSGPFWALDSDEVRYTSEFPTPQQKADGTRRTIGEMTDAELREHLSRYEDVVAGEKGLTPALSNASEQVKAAKAELARRNQTESQRAMAMEAPRGPSISGEPTAIQQEETTNEEITGTTEPTQEARQIRPDPRQGVQDSEGAGLPASQGPQEGAQIERAPNANEEGRVEEAVAPVSPQPVIPTAPDQAQGDTEIPLQGDRPVQGVLEQPTAPPTQEPTVPTPPEEGQGVRRLAERVIRDESQPEEVRRELAQNPKIFYRKFSNTALMDASRSASEEELTAMAVAGDGRIRAHAIIEQANRASLSGDAKTAGETYALASTLFTDAAQLLNTAKAVRNPLGLVTMIDSLVHKNGRNLNQEQKDNLLNLSREKINAEIEMERTAKMAEADFSEENEAAYVKAREKAGEANREVQQFISEVTPFSMSELIVMTMQGNMLTPLSLAKNVGWNISYYPIRTGTESAASALDWAYSNLTGKPRTTKALPLPSQYEMQAMWEGLKVAFRELLTGPSPESYVRQEVQRGFRPLRAWVQAITGENLPRGPNGKVVLTDRIKKIYEGIFGIPAEVMFRFLNVGDKFVRRGAESRTLVEGAKLRNLTGREFEQALKFPDKETLNRLDTESRKAILVQENAITKILSHIDREISAVPVAGPALKVLGRIVALYRQVPVNLVMTTLDFAIPEVGMGRSVFRGLAGDRRGALQSLATSMMGSMMYVAASLMWKAGLISEPADKDDKKRRSVQYEQMGPGRINLTGLGRYMAGEDSTYRFGDRTVSYDTLAIAGAIFHIFTLGKAREEAIEIRRGQSNEERNVLAKYAEDRLASFPGLTSFAMDQSFLASTNAFLEAIQDTSADSTLFNRWMQNVFRMVSSIPVPNTVETIARTQYMAIPELRGDTLEESIANVWKFKTSPLRGAWNSLTGDELTDEKLIVKRGLFGEPIPRTPEGANPYIYHLIDVTKGERKAPDAFKQKLLDIYDETGLPQTYPTPPDRSLQMGGVDVRLTNEDYDKLQQAVGSLRRYYAERTINNPSFDTRTPVEQVFLLDKMYSDAASAARKQFVAQPEIFQRYFSEEGQDRVRSLSPRARVRQERSTQGP